MTWTLEGNIRGPHPSIVVVDSDTPVSRPDVEVVLWVKNSTNAIDGDLRLVDPT